MKRGGRESGQRGTGPDPQSFGDEAPSHEQPSGGIVAAAKPAALYKKLADAGRQMRELAKAKNERIRALEAELAIVRSKYREADMMQDGLRARAERLEGALCDHCGHRWYMFDEFEGPDERTEDC